MDQLTSGLFEHCLSLQEIYIPRNIKNIRRNTFKECKKLKKINMYKKTQYDEGSFIDCNNIKIERYR